MKDTFNEIYDRYQIPLFISENGMGAIDTIEEDGTIRDDYRSDYLIKHAKAVKDACEKDLVDCFSYAWRGPVDIVSAGTGEMRKCYGFVYVDMDDAGHGTMERRRKQSFDVYRRIIETNGDCLEEAV